MTYAIRNDPYKTPPHHGRYVRDAHSPWAYSVTQESSGIGGRGGGVDERRRGEVEEGLHAGNELPRPYGLGFEEPQSLF